MTITQPLAPPLDPHGPDHLEQLLKQALHRIQVDDDELDEARRRRRLLCDALEVEFPGSTTYINGSVAHGDALTPLTDVDLGVIVAEARHTHGPGRKGCSDLQERAANAIRRALQHEFPGATVHWKGRKRSILVRFSKPVDPTEDDFTADVIVAIDNPHGQGLYIPNHLSWDRSDPQQHTDMVAAANRSSDYSYARTVRLLKHWNRSNGHPLCSWNIKALALDALTEPAGLLDGMLAWFDHSTESLNRGLTPDPAGVADKPIAVNKDMTLRQVVDQLAHARDQLRSAIKLQTGGWPLQAHELLAKFFNDQDMLPAPGPGPLHAELARRLRPPTTTKRPTAGAGLGVAAATGRETTPVRSWAPRS